MPMEISSDLINQLKVSLRKEAKLSSFYPVDDYSDSSFPSLPTVAEAIAELDASAPYLRCRNCKGKLLRGIESLICVFCGKQQRTIDNPPDPIKFTSTSGYKWFLSSLNLDGSEMVEPLKEVTGSSRGAKAPVVKGIAVSKFLDLEIQWSAREEKSVSSDDGQSVQNKNPLNVGRIILDDFFIEGRGDVSKVDPTESKPLEDDFKDPRSLSLFDSVKSQGIFESQQNENVGFLKGKDVQKNVSFEEHENLSLFSGRDAQGSASLAQQGNFGFFDGKDAQRTNSSKNDESFGFFEGNDAQRNSSSKDDKDLDLFESKDAQRNSSSTEDANLGLFEGAPSSNAGLQTCDDQVVASSSDWDSDFQSADHNHSQEKITGDPFVSSPVDLAAHMDSVFGSGKDLLNEKPADSSTAYVSKAGDWLQDDDLFGNVTGKTLNSDPAVLVKTEGQVVGGNESSSMDIDWIGDDLWQTSGTKPIEKTFTDDNNDDDWNDFASSTNSKIPNNPLSQTMQSSQKKIFDGLVNVNEPSENERQNAGTSMISDISKGQEESDIFGTWDSFASSSAVQVKQNPEMNLFGQNDNHVDLGGQTNSEEVKAMPSGTSTLERTSDLASRDETLHIVGTTTISHKSKSDVAEELMSQMHDLSFMLETNLSVPPVSKTK